MPVAPATIVRTKRSCPGTSTTLERAARRQLEPREAELDRDPALALLGQAVGVDAGERLDQRGLAVVDVTGGPERQRRGAVIVSAQRRQHARARRSRPRPRRSCAGRAARRLVAHARDDRRVAGAQPRVQLRRAPARAPSPRPPGPRARAAAASRRRRARPTRTIRTAAAPPRPPAIPACSALGARLELALAARRASRSTGISRTARSRIAVQAQRRLERGQRELVDPHRARERMRRACARSPPPCPPTIPACGPPSSLSPEKQTTSAPAAMLSRAAGSSREHVAQRVVAARRARPEPRSSISGSPRRARELGELGQRGLLGEADRAEVRCVHPHQRRRVRADRALVVADPRAVRRARPRPAARPTPRGSRGSGTSRRSRPAGRARSRPRARRASAASASSTAAALLLTASAASAPVSSRSSRSTCAWRLPRSPRRQRRTRGWSSRSRRRRSPRAPRTRAARARGSCGSRRRSR